MFGKRAVLKMMMKKQMAGVPDDQLDKILDMVDSNPELFKKMAEEMQQKTATGMDQQSAMMEIAQKYQSELKGAFNNQ